MRRLLRSVLAAIVLLARFARALAVSGLQTLGVILAASVGQRRPPPMALVRVPFAPMSPRGAAVLGCLVSLTPGTTTIDVDMERRELLVHVLDASDTDAVLAGIRRDFEPGLVILFGQP